MISWLLNINHKSNPCQKDSHLHSLRNKALKNLLKVLKNAKEYKI